LRQNAQHHAVCFEKGGDFRLIGPFLWCSNYPGEYIGLKLVQKRNREQKKITLNISRNSALGRTIAAIHQ
jgi:hypothetical protein